MMQIQYNILLPLKYMIEEQKCILRIESYLYTYKRECEFKSHPVKERRPIFISYYCIYTFSEQKIKKWNFILAKKKRKTFENINRMIF